MENENNNPQVTENANSTEKDESANSEILHQHLNPDQRGRDEDGMIFVAIKPLGGMLVDVKKLAKVAPNSLHQLVGFGLSLAWNQCKSAHKKEWCEHHGKSLTPDGRVPKLTDEQSK